MEDLPPAHVPEQEIQVGAPVEIASPVRTLGRIRNKPDRYGFTPKVLHITIRKSLRQFGDRAHSSIMFPFSRINQTFQVIMS